LLLMELDLPFLAALRQMRRKLAGLESN
jgi:hypothetical protein